MQTQFITDEVINHIQNRTSTPCYVYSEDLLRQQAEKVLQFPHRYWLTVRYAMKANPNVNILRLFHSYGIQIDASSEYEVVRALAAGIPGQHIQLSWQQLPTDLPDLLGKGIQFVSTSLHQLEYYGKQQAGGSVGIRINPGVWSGAFKKIDTGWPTSSFGIRHEYVDQAKTIANNYSLSITKLHIHIGSENTPAAWAEAAQQAIQLMKQLPDVTTLNMGGGFKIAIMPYEKTADIEAIGSAVSEIIEQFYQETGRKISLEIEPWKFLVMNTCSVVARIEDIVDTWPDGYQFIKLNTGMTELPRVSMYGIQQPIYIIKKTPSNGNANYRDYVVVGHCCESGDLLTCILYQCDDIEPISLEQAGIGDYCVIQSCGAYNASMAMKNYNSYPEAAEVLLKSDGSIGVMRQRQTLEQITQNENIVG